MIRSDDRAPDLTEPFMDPLRKPVEPDLADEAREPRHVAIIMDGNGRWALRRGLPRFEGHRRGVEAVRRTIRAAQARGIRYLTVFSFSNENWSRPREEVSFLLGLLRRFIRNDLAELHANGVKVRVIGERAGLPTDLVALLDEAERTTSGNSAMTLIVAFNYGGRQELLRAAQRFAQAGLGEGATPDDLRACLDAPEIPDADLVIRTSGEQRISNFLLWQAAYAEFVFLPVLWPDFGPADLDAALNEYAGRDRRFGAVKAAAS
jgi:undecaprenyl diphosphate synthase